MPDDRDAPAAQETGVHRGHLRGHQRFARCGRSRPDCGDHGQPCRADCRRGVSGVHRLFSRLSSLQRANVLIVAAGMEGALPSVVAGLVSRPVIAVPTSVGYGAHFGGLAPLLGMLNSCGSGVSVVNIDNGFGAGTLPARSMPWQASPNEDPLS